MAYKFQLGAFVASGSIKAEDGVNAGTAGVADAGAVAGATSIDGSGDLTMGTITMTGFSVDADGDTALKSLAVDDSSTIGCDSDADIMTLAAQSLVLANDVDFNIAKAGGLQLGGVAMTATAAELNLLDNVSGLVQADFTKLAAVDATAAELNLLDGDTSRGTTAVASGDGFVHNDAGTMRMTSIDKIADLFAGTGLAASSGVLSLDQNEVGTGHAVSVPNDSFLFVDGADNATKRDSFVNLAAGLAGGAGLGASGGLISVNVDDSGIEIDSDTLRLKDNGVTLAKMAGLARGKIIIGDSSGDPSALTLGSAAQFGISDGDDLVYRSLSGDATLAANGAISLAAAQTNVTSLINASMGKIGTAANQEYIDFGTANEIKFAVNNSLVATVEAGKFVIAGDLQVNGTTTSIDSTTINISSSFTFEGPADDHETVLSCGSPTADATLELFQGAAGTYYMPAFSDSNIKSTVIAATAAEINLMDGGNARGTTALADGDGFIHNDNGTMRQTNVVKIAEYAFDKVSGDATVADNGALTIANNAVSLAKLAGIAAGKLIIGDSNGDPSVVTVSGDATLSAAGALTIAADAIESGMLNDNVISGQTELTSGNAVDADEMLISDGGVLKKIGLDSLKSYMSDAAADVVAKADGDTLAVGVNFFADMGADGEDTVTLPASAGLTIGQSIKIKAPSDCSAARFITIARAGSQTIDGAVSIRLESPFAAVELVYVAADTFRVF